MNYMEIFCNIFWICAQNLRPHPIRAIEMIRSNRKPFSTKFVRPLKWVFWWVLLLSRICQEYRWRSQSIYQIVPTCSSLRPKTPKNPLKIPGVKTWAFSVLFSNYAWRFLCVWDRVAFISLLISARSGLRVCGHSIYKLFYIKTIWVQVPQMTERFKGNSRGTHTTVSPRRISNYNILSYGDA